MRALGTWLAIAFIAACSSGGSAGADANDTSVPAGVGNCAKPYVGSCDNPSSLHCTDMRGTDSKAVPIITFNCKDNQGTWSTSPCARGVIGGCMVDRPKTNECAIVWGPFNKQPADPPATSASVEQECAKLSGTFIPP